LFILKKYFIFADKLKTMFFFFLKEFKVKDLFEIWQGVSYTPPKEPTSPEQGKVYRLVNLSSVDFSLKDIIPGNLVSLPADKRIPPEKILQRDDYLLSCKGVVKGFPMRYAGEPYFDPGKGGLVSSSHFFLLRLREPMKVLAGSVLFMHNLLDSCISDFNEIAARRKGILKYLTIKDVEEFGFRWEPTGEYEAEFARVNELTQAHDACLAELKKARHELEMYNLSLKQRYGPVKFEEIQSPSVDWEKIRSKSKV